MKKEIARYAKEMMIMRDKLLRYLKKIVKRTYRGDCWENGSLFFMPWMRGFTYYDKKREQYVTGIGFCGVPVFCDVYYSSLEPRKGQCSMRTGIMCPLHSELICSMDFFDSSKADKILLSRYKLHMDYGNRAAALNDLNDIIIKIRGIKLSK